MAPRPRNHSFSWFARHLEEITEGDLRAALEREDIGPADFLILAKMLCTKWGMTDREWEENFCEQEIRQSLRQIGVSEDFVTAISASLIKPKLCGIKGKIVPFIPIDKHGKLECTYPMCLEKPCTVVTITREKKGSGIMDAIVVVLCKEHYRRVERVDTEAAKLRHTIAEAAIQQMCPDRL